MKLIGSTYAYKFFSYQKNHSETLTENRFFSDKLRIFRTFLMLIGSDERKEAYT
jgi:hypothetical protein